MSNDTSPAIASDLQRLLASDSTESSSEYGYDAFDEDDPLAWFPEPDLGRDWEAICSSKKVKKDLENAMKELPLEITPSEFTAFAFRMPKQHGYGYERFSFEGRRHMFAIYNTSAQRVLLCCARQTEKSTTLGNITLNYSCLIPAFKTLYVSPSAMQTKVFSNDRIKEPIETSPILKTFTNRVLAQNVFEKQFINRSKVTLRYSFLNADRCVTGDTRVYFADGSTATVGDVFRDRDSYIGKYVHAVDPDSFMLVQAKLTDAVYQGKRKVYAVRLVGGAELHCTSNQPLLTMHGWQPVENLPVGSFVATPRVIPHGAGSDASVEEFRRVGYLVGCQAADSIPRKYFKGNAEQVRGLLATLFVNGWIATTKKRPCEIGYASSQVRLLCDIKHLLQRFGIFSCISQRKAGDYALVMQNYADVITFCDRIGISGQATRIAAARAAAAKRAPQLGTECSADLDATDTLWLKIESIDVIGEEDTYDLSIEKYENYLTDGLFVHNTRGIPAYMLLLDEIQDLLAENIPVIERCTDHAPDHYKRFIYSGTPKSLDNTIENYRSRFARQGEWVVPCERCGGGDYKYWNILGEQNIGKHGLICAKCGKLINPQHPEAQWAFMVDDAPFESYRVNGLMVPWKKWSEILFDYETNSRAKFFNEVLGLSYDSGTRPLTLKQVRDCCKEHISMHPKDLRKYYTSGYDKPVFMGLDYGTGENSYTIITIGTYVDSKFRIIYMERCIGEMMEPERQVEHIIELANRYKVTRIGADYGGGYDRNDKLTRTFGTTRIIKFQYMARARKKIEWDPRLMRFKVQRTEVMSDIFNAIKRNQFEFPRWAEFESPFAMDMLNIFSEYNEQLRQIQYKHSVDKPDDSFHSLLYCFLASMTVIPRPDVIAPRRQINHEQAIFGNPYTGPTDQGRETIL